MQTNVDAQFLVAYIHVSRSSAAAAAAAIRAFKTAAEAQERRVACLQREGTAYSNQFVVFIAAGRPSDLLQCTESAAFATLKSDIDALRIAPTVIKSFRSVADVPLNIEKLTRHFARTDESGFSDIFSVSHLDVIPSIPGNVDRALALLTREVSALNAAQQQQPEPGGDGCFMFFGLQQTDRANHFTLVQGWTSSASKIAYDESGAKAFKEQFYSTGPLVGGCPWDEQLLLNAA